MTNIVERLKEYAGKDRRDVSNPCMTAREAIVVADHIISIEAKLAAAEAEVARLSALRELFANRKLVDKDAVVVSADDLRVMLFGPVNSERGEKIARRLGAIQQLESALAASEVKS